MLLPELIHPAANVSTSQVVLDTNVVLDWLVFKNPVGEAIEQALAGGALQWVATADMRNEIDHVLSRGLGSWPIPVQEVDAAWARWAHLKPHPILRHPATPRCSDADDQKFIDLAMSLRCPWLLTRDRALLKLTRAAARHGVTVATPEAWQRAQQASR